MTWDGMGWDCGLCTKFKYSIMALRYEPSFIGNEFKDKKLKIMKAKE